MSKKIFYIVSISLLIIFIISISIYKFNQEYVIDNISIQTRNMREYYVMEGIYEGEYDLQYLDFIDNYAKWYENNGSSDYLNLINEEQLHKVIPVNSNVEASDIIDFDIEKIMNYNEYTEFCNKWGISQKYKDSSKKYIIYSRTSYIPYGYFIPELASIKYNKASVDLYIYDVSGSSNGLSGYVYIIPTDKSISNVNRKNIIKKEEFDQIPEYSLN